MKSGFSKYSGIVSVMLAAGAVSFAAEKPLLEYLFNETGVNAASSGTVNAPLEFRSRSGNRLADLHGDEGSGVSGKPGDRAFNNTDADMGGGGGVAKTEDNVDDIDGLVSFTYCGWFKTAGDVSFVGSLARLGKDYDENKGWQFLGNNGDGVLVYVDTGSRVFAGGKPTDLSVLAQTEKWVFFAVTYDGTKSGNNVKIYAGDQKKPVALAGTQTINSSTSDKNGVALAVGNEINRSRAFSGFLDNIRLYGTKTSRDNTGALTVEQLEAIRAGDLTFKETAAAAPAPAETKPAEAKTDKPMETAAADKAGATPSYFESVCPAWE